MEGNEMSKEVIIKTYTITWKEESDGKTSLQRVNDGFNLIELLGLLSLTQLELLDTFRGKIVPDTITRQVVDDDTKEKDVDL